MSAAMIELLVLFAIAAFVLYRLKSVLGTRTGYEEPPEYLRPNGAQRPGQPDLRPVESPMDPEPEESELTPEVRTALAKMRDAEPDFVLGEFLQGAKGAYEMVVMAFAEGDRDTLKNLLAPDVYGAFEAGIKDREDQGLTVDTRFIGLRDAVLDTASFDTSDAVAELSVRFTAETITAVRDAENRIVDGDPNEVQRQTDVWTFSRAMGAPDPNWLLTSTG